MLEMFSLMIVVNIICVILMLMVTKEIPFAASADSDEADGSPRQSVCGQAFGVFRSMARVPKFLLQLVAVQTLVWVGLAMWNKNGSLWFGESLANGNASAAARTTDKMNYDHGIAAYSTAGIYQSVFQIVASLMLIVIVYSPRVSLRFLYASCLFVGACVSVLAFWTQQIPDAQDLSVMEKLSETAANIVPFGIVVMASKRAELNGETISTALCMAYLNCACTLGQFLQMALTSLFLAAMPDSQAFPSLFLLGGIFLAFACFSVVLLKDVFAQTM